MGGAAPAAAAAAGTGTIRLPAAEPSTLDPAHVRDTVASSYATEIFAGLTRIGPDLTPEGDLAQWWSVADDGLAYRFWLRAGLQFHDGRALTAADVKWSWERALAPQTGSLSAGVFLGDIDGADDVMAGRATELRGVQAIGERTLRVRLSRPASFFPAQVSSGPTLVVDRRDVARGPDWFRRPNGSGPYQLVTWERESRIVLERADSFRQRVGGPARAEYLQLDPGENLLRYEQDELDIVGVGGANVERFSDPREPRSPELLRTPTLSVQYLGFNTTVAPFDDVSVRRALALAIDRPRIARVTLRGKHQEARGIVPPGMPGHRADYAGLPFDLAAARAELARSRYGSAAALPEIVLTTSGGGLLEGPLVRAIVRPWRTNLGVSVSVQQLEFNDFLRELDEPASKLQMFLLGWSADFPDPVNFLDVLFASGRPDNYARFNDSLVDFWLSRARSAGDEAARLELYERVESRVVERAVVAPLFFSVAHELVQPWVEGYRGRPIEREWLTEITIKRD